MIIVLLYSQLVATRTPLRLVKLSTGVMLAALAACSTPAIKIGYVNSTQLMQQYHGTAAKRQEITHLATTWQRSLDSLTNVVQALQPAATARQQELARYRTQLQQKIQTAGQQADQQLLQAVNAYLKQYGQANKYDFILGATDAGNIVYAVPTRDITGQVLTGLNQEYGRTHTARP